MSYQDFLNEAVEQTTFSTMAAGINYALSKIEKKGFTTDPEELATVVGMGPSKPSDGKTNKYHISLYKNGKLQKKMLQIQITGLGSRGYELNYYIN